jgi:hypothetical protein
MIHALTASIMAALLLACLVRAAQPGMLLGFAGGWWEAWLIHRPRWLPGKPSGDCAFCAAFWLPGVPVALLAGLCTPAGWWALAVPFLVATLTDKLLSNVR